MCGRYQLATDPRALVETLGARSLLEPPDAFEPRWNIAPSEPPRSPDSRAVAPRRLTRVAIVRRGDEDDESDGHDTGTVVLDRVIWPLVPAWAKGEVPKYSTANARSETLSDKPSFRSAWKAGRRCLVLASGFYEWQAVAAETGTKTPKQPWLLAPANDGWFCFGGLWERSWTAAGEAVRSCTIVTMAANPLMREIHNAGANRHRMPLMLTGADREAWLEGSAEEAREAIRPYPAEEMLARRVARSINDPNRDGADVVEPSD